MRRPNKRPLSQNETGPLDEPQVSQYRADPFYEDSLLLRSCDEAAKVPGEETESLDFFLQYVRREAIADPGLDDDVG